MKLGIGSTGEGCASFATQVERASGEKPAHCYQCGKCTAGCPMAFAMDIEPSRVMRLVQLGQREAVLQSHTIWLCASCETCTTRCPQEVDLSRVMDALCAMARRAGHTPERVVAAMNEGFLGSVKARGRVHETMMTLALKLRTGQLLQDAEKGPAMLLKGKLSLKGHKSPHPEQVQRIFENVARMEGEGE